MKVTNQNEKLAELWETDYQSAIEANHENIQDWFTQLDINQEDWQSVDYKLFANKLKCLLSAQEELIALIVKQNKIERGE